MTDTIKPPWAISLWSNSDHIFAELPSIGGSKAHVVKVKNDAKGLAKILYLAKSRDIDSKLGSKGDPTQDQIKSPKYDLSMVRRPKDKVRFTPAQKINAREILRKLGVI